MSISLNANYIAMRSIHEKGESLLRKQHDQPLERPGRDNRSVASANENDRRPAS